MRFRTYPGIPAVQDLICGSPGGTAGHSGVQPVADLPAAAAATAAAAAAVKQHLPLPFLQPLGQASVVTSPPPWAQLSPFAEFCVSTFPHVDRNGQNEHKLQMLHSVRARVRVCKKKQNQNKNNNKTIKN